MSHNVVGGGVILLYNPTYKERNVPRVKNYSLTPLPRGCINQEDIRREKYAPLPVGEELGATMEWRVLSGKHK